MGNEYNVAIVGATGAVGQQMIRTLESHRFPINELRLLASARSKGKTVTYNGEPVTIQEATPDAFSGIDIAFFSAGGGISKKLAPHAVESGALVIDNTSAFRMDENVPLVVPEVNPEDIFTNNGIIANPNCSTIQLVAALHPLRNAFGLKRIIASTYQAVSGAGYTAIEELKRQSQAILDEKDCTPDILPVSSLDKKHQIAFNAIPQIDVFVEGGYTKEEMKMVNETKKILHDDSLKIGITCVRIAVVTGHSESVYVEFDQETNVDDVRRCLEDTPGVTVIDDPQNQAYPLATDAANKEDVFVGRIRQDLDDPKGFHLWIVSDNLLKGAATNSVQIAEEYIRRQS